MIAGHPYMMLNGIKESANLIWKGRKLIGARPTTSTAYADASIDAKAIFLKNILGYVEEYLVKNLCNLSSRRLCLFLESLNNSCKFYNRLVARFNDM